MSSICVTLLSCPETHWANVKSLYDDFLFNDVEIKPSLGHLSSGAADVVSVVL